MNNLSTKFTKKFSYLTRIISLLSIIFLNILYSYLSNKENYIDQEQYLQYSDNLSNEAMSVFYYVILGIFLSIQLFVLISKRLNIGNGYTKETKLPYEYQFFQLVPLLFIIPITLNVLTGNNEGSLFFAGIAFMLALGFQVIDGALTAAVFSDTFTTIFITMAMFIAVILIQKSLSDSINGFYILSSGYWLVFQSRSAFKNYLKTKPVRVW